MKQQELIAALVKDLMERTSWPANGLPPESSSFQTTHADLRIVADNTKNPAPPRLNVCHRWCDTKIHYVYDPAAPEKASFYCASRLCYDQGNSFRHWDVDEIQRSQEVSLQRIFYTVLLENPEDLKEWPDRLVDKTDGQKVFLGIRPTTKEEMCEKRVKRLLEIRRAAPRAF